MHYVYGFAENIMITTTFKIVKIHFITSAGVQVTSLSDKCIEDYHFLVFDHIENIEGKEIKIGSQYRIFETPEYKNRFAIALI